MVSRFLHRIALGGAGIALSFCALVLLSPVAGAQSGQAFSISPPLIELSADPGQTVEAQLKITNVSSGPLRVKVQANDFGSKNETGEPNIIFDEAKETSYSLRQWVALPGEFTLASKETKQVIVPVNVPKNAEPGGHYGVIRFTGTSNGGGENDVSLAASIGSLVLLRVSGDIQESALVEDFYSAGANFEKKSFFESGPLQFVARIKNTGNIHIKPTGTVKVEDGFGNEVASVRINGNPETDEQPGSILPQSVRRFAAPLEDKQLFGRYKATLSLDYGDKKTLEQTTYFWVVPYKLILGGIAIAALLAAGIYWGIKRYNAYIIQKAEHSVQKKK